MKTLLLLRHGKSSWDDPGLADAARPLGERGRRAAPKMGRWLRERGLMPDVIVSSPAVRARSTALLAAEAAAFVGSILFDGRIYEATPAGLVDVVRGLPEAAGSALIVGHNPGLEALVSAFAGHSERLPTAALAQVELQVARWADVVLAQGRVLGVWRPKALA